MSTLSVTEITVVFTIQSILGYQNIFKSIYMHILLINHLFSRSSITKLCSICNINNDSLTNTLYSIRFEALSSMHIFRKSSLTQFTYFLSYDPYFSLLVFYLLFLANRLSLSEPLDSNKCLTSISYSSL